MKVYARVKSVEKKEVVTENKDGKREKRIVYVAKLGEIGGLRVTFKSDEPFESAVVVGHTLAVAVTPTQAKLPTEKDEKPDKREASSP